MITPSLQTTRICFLCNVKVVILHQHFNTPVAGGPLRSYYLAKALLDAGHSVTVITAGKERRTFEIDGIEIRCLQVDYENRFGFYQRGVAFAKFAWQSYRVASQIQGVDLVYAISVPLTVGIPAIMLKKLHKIPFVFEVGDLWPDAPIELGFIKNFVLRITLLQFEKNIYRNARSIVALSDPIRERINRKVPGKRIEVIPNMADTTFYQPAKNNVVEFTAANPFQVAYIGAIGFANGLDNYLECARACLKAGLPVRFILCGDGAFRESLEKVRNLLKIENLSFVPFQNREGVRALLKTTHAIFVSYRPFPILETGSPNKYFDGLAAGKLVLLNFGGWIRREVEQHECGVYIHQHRPHEIVDTILPFLTEQGRLARYQANARSLAELKYSRKILGNAFVRALEKS